MRQNLLKVAGVAILMAAVTVSAVYSSPFKDDYWENVAASDKASFMTYGINDRPALDIGAIAYQERVMQDFWGNDWPEQRDNVQAVINALEDQWPDREAIVVIVHARQSAYFWPNEITFTQGNSQYNLSRGDIIPMEADSPFTGGEVKEGVFAEGFVAIPQGVNLSERFQLWYKDHSDGMGPLQ